MSATEIPEVSHLRFAIPGILRTHWTDDEFSEGGFSQMSPVLLLICHTCHCLFRVS